MSKVASSEVLGVGSRKKQRGRLAMQLEGIGVTRLDKHGPFQLLLKFGKEAYCVVEIRRGDDAAAVARKLRELAGQVEQRRG
jgi:hypothetical protein